MTSDPAVPDEGTAPPDGAGPMPVISDAQVQQRTWLRVAVICLVAFPLVAAVNATTLVTDAARSGAEIDARMPWLEELTSALGFLALVPAVVALERRFPLRPGRMGQSLLAHVPGSVAFSLAHVGIMVALRHLLVPVVTSEPYRFFVDPFPDLLYEYRKDVFPYAVLIGLLTLSRHIEEGRQETAAARARARETGRLTLKSGGRMIFLQGSDLQWAKAAGNYVEVHAAGRTHLPRITLTDLAEQLRDAQVEVVRVHRSYLVNRAKVREVRPTSSGDMMIRMDDGTVVKGSRRYRDQLDA